MAGNSYGVCGTWSRSCQGRLLRDRSGKIWPVKLRNVDKKTFFLDGWTTFLKQNCVEQGDVFVLTFDGHSVFDFKLLGNGSCEKKMAGSINGTKYHSRKRKRVDPFDIDLFKSEQCDSQITHISSQKSEGIGKMDCLSQLKL